MRLSELCCNLPISNRGPHQRIWYMFWFITFFHTWYNHFHMEHIVRLAWICVRRPWSHVFRPRINYLCAFWDEHVISCQQEERASETLGNIKYPLSVVREVLRSLEAKLWWRLRDPNLPFTSQLHASGIARDPTIRHCHRLKTANPPSHEPNTCKTGRYGGSMSCSNGTWQTGAKMDFVSQIWVWFLSTNTWSLN